MTAKNGQVSKRRAGAQRERNGRRGLLAEPRPAGRRNRLVRAGNRPASRSSADATGADQRPPAPPTSRGVRSQRQAAMPISSANDQTDDAKPCVSGDEFTSVRARSSSLRRCCSARTPGASPPATRPLRRQRPSPSEAAAKPAKPTGHPPRAPGRGGADSVTTPDTTVPGVP